MNPEHFSIYHSVAQYIDLGIIGLDKNKKIIIWNRWMSEKSCFSSQSSSQKLLEDIFPDISGTRFHDAINNAYKFGAPAIISNVFNRSPLSLFNDNKEKIIQHINVIPVDNDGEKSCIIQVADVSASVDREKALEKQVKERKSTEKILRHTLRELENASEVKSDFLASMSHEIRTPMNGIIGMTQMLKRTDINAKQKEYINIIDDSATSLLTVINDILDFSKIEAGKLHLEENIFEISEVTEDVVKLLLPEINKKQLSIKTFFDNDLAKSYLGDSTRLKQILINLLSNAIKFTEDGGITISVQKNVNDNLHPSLKISVTDTGIGIEQAKLSSLFSAFTQADSSTTRKYGGTGLGLAISKKLVELMNGSIAVESSPGNGSTFWFTITLGKPSSKKAASKTNSDQLIAKLKANKFSGSVLLVEDVEVNQIIARSILEELGFTVTIAQNGQEAIESFSKQEFSLIFMDCQMPVMDGFEATKHIRKLEAGNPTPIIALTALAMKGDSQKCFDSGMDDYISKPYEMNDIISCVNKWLKN